MNPFQQVKAFLHRGLARLRSSVQKFGCNQFSVSELLAHVILELAVHVGLTMLGVPSVGAIIIGAFVSYFAGPLVKKLVEVKSRE